MMIIDNKFNIGDFVYVVTDVEQDKGIITSIRVLPNNGITYMVSVGSKQDVYFEFELSAERNVLLTTTN